MHKNLELNLSEITDGQSEILKFGINENNEIFNGKKIAETLNEFRQLKSDFRISSQFLWIQGIK